MSRLTYMHAQMYNWSDWTVVKLCSYFWPDCFWTYKSYTLCNI